MEYIKVVSMIALLVVLYMIRKRTKGTEGKLRRELQLQRTHNKLLASERERMVTLNRELLLEVDSLIREGRDTARLKYTKGYAAGVAYAGLVQEYSKDAYKKGYKEGFEVHRGHAEYMKGVGKEPNFSRRAYQHRSEESSSKYANGGPKYNSNDESNGWMHGWTDTEIEAMIFMGLTRLTKESINKAYKSLAKQWHPDRMGGCSDKMKGLNAARDLLREAV